MSEKKYESIWWVSTLLTFILFNINNMTIRNDVIYIGLFIVYALFIFFVRINYNKYIKEKQEKNI
ncbi:hypothetical protein DX927_00175 [Bacillus swezeyi]|uniref:Uncharacterized protein n=1 Tax=Bacillus swezeyi TaxID=1925020 RepID=A0A5M8S3G6_9BACI|nr:hypothetical protein DX927_00175 [Bacillus swezeyi]